MQLGLRTLIYDQKDPAQTVAQTDMRSQAQSGRRREVMEESDGDLICGKAKRKPCGGLSCCF